MVKARVGLEHLSPFKVFQRELLALKTKYKTAFKDERSASEPKTGDIDFRRTNSLLATAFANILKTESGKDEIAEFLGFITMYCEFPESYADDVSSNAMHSLANSFFWLFTTGIFPGVYHHVMDDEGMIIGHPHPTTGNPARTYGITDETEACWFVRGIFNVQSDAVYVNELESRCILLDYGNVDMYIKELQAICKKFADVV